MTKRRLLTRVASRQLPQGFADLLREVKIRIQSAQTRAIAAVNSELIRLYWDVGRLIDERQQREGWGATVIPRIAAELRHEFAELKGFSERNIQRMLAFYRSYPEPDQFVPQPAAQLSARKKVTQAASQLPASLLCRRSEEDPADLWAEALERVRLGIIENLGHQQIRKSILPARSGSIHGPWVQ